VQSGKVEGNIPSEVISYVIQAVSISEEHFSVIVDIQIDDNEGSFSYRGIAKSEEEAKSRCSDMFNRIMRTI